MVDSSKLNLNKVLLNNQFIQKMVQSFIEESGQREQEIEQQALLQISEDLLQQDVTV